MPRARRNPAARAAAALACLGIVLAAAAWFVHANGQQANGENTGGWVLTEPATTSGSWHWLEADGDVGEALKPESVIVPGDRVVFVPADAADGTDGADGAGHETTTFALPATAGNDTQGRVFRVAADGAIYTLRPVDDDGISFERSRLWMAFAAGAGAAFLGCGAAAIVGAAGARRRAAAVGPAGPADPEKPGEPAA